LGARYVQRLGRYTSCENKRGVGFLAGNLAPRLSFKALFQRVLLLKHWRKGVSDVEDGLNPTRMSPGAIRNYGVLRLEK
jgi:hypothetical protein